MHRRLWGGRGNQQLLEPGQGIRVNTAPESRCQQQDCTSQGLRQQGGMGDAAGAPFLLKISIIPFIFWLIEDISSGQEGTGGCTA